MSDHDSVVNNPLFGAVIGTQIGNNAHAEADRIRAESENKSLASAADNGVLVAGILSKRNEALRQEVADLTQSEKSYIYTLAGVRGVTRELLEELRKSDPNNPLLEKKIRDKVFDQGYISSESNVKGKTGRERTSMSAIWRDNSYGAENSNMGGPEKSQITPNIQVRAEAEVPSHVSDREKLLGLVERLTAEVKKNNPDAAILQDKVMLDVFADYTINEMVRQEKHRP